jgi:hypothetical protein
MRKHGTQSYWPTFRSQTEYGRRAAGHTPSRTVIPYSLRNKSFVLTESRSTMAYLEIHADCETERQLTLGDAISFGRHRDNDVILCDDQVSRHHARITRHGENFLLEDLSSSNGTFLRARRLRARTPSELVDGDEIQIGSVRLVFHLYRFISCASTDSYHAAWSQNSPKPASRSPSL